MDLRQRRDAYLEEGLSEALSNARACQDVFLLCLAKSEIHDYVTIKGGVVMQNLSGEKRRATRDIDFDLIHYELSEKAVDRLFSKISNDYYGISRHGPSEELHQQDYQGLRVHVRIADTSGFALEIKTDIGVHKYLDLMQEDCYFDVDAEEGKVSLLANSKEQIFTEKLKSLLNHGIRSTRYKDIYDLYYLCLIAGLDENKLSNCMKTLIFEAPNAKETSIHEVEERARRVLLNPAFFNRFRTAKNKWLDVDEQTVIEGILGSLRKLETKAESNEE